MPTLKSIAIGYAMFLAYSFVQSKVIRPMNLPVISTL